MEIRYCDSERDGLAIMGLIREHGGIMHPIKIRETLQMSMGCYRPALAWLREQNMVKRKRYGRGAATFLVLVSHADRLKIERVFRQASVHCKNCDNFNPRNANWKSLKPCYRCVRNPRFNDRFIPNVDNTEDEE